MTIVLRKIFFTGLLIFLITSSFYAQLTVTSASACPSQTVTLSATWPNVTPSSFTISRPAGASTVQTGATFTVSDPGPGPIIVYTITGSGTTLSGPVTSSTTATLTIIAPPPLTITPAYASYCYGATATIAVSPATSAYNYSVAGPAGTPVFPTSPSNVINIPSLSPPSYNGQYTVTANIAGCVRTGTAQISVAPNSQIVVTPSTNICQGQSYTLTANLASGVGYNWSGPNLSSATQSVALNNIQYNQSGNYVVTANISFSGTNSTTLCARSATTSVIVVETSSPVISASPNATVCQGANLTLAASATVSSGTPGYSWSGPQGFSSSQQNPVLTAIAPANAGTYTFTALFSNSSLTCPRTATISVGVIATADPNPVAPANVCQNGVASLTVSAPGTTNFSWTGPAFSSPVNSSNPIIANIQPTATGAYYVTAIFSSGGVTCTKTKSVVINVVPVNTITVIPPADVCQPDNAYLQASAIGATTYSWDGPNGNVGYTSNTTIYHPAVSASGIYTVTAGFSGGAVTCYNTNTVSLTVKPLLNFTLSSPGLVCYNSTVHIAGPAGATSYSWTSSTSFTASSQNIDLLSVQPSDGGTYSLTVSLNGCITTGSTNFEVLSPINFTQPFFSRTICRGDTVYLSAPITGGTGNYAYSWDPSIYLSANVGSSVVGVPLGTTIYNVTVHDIVCPEYSISGAFNVTVNQPPQLNISLDKIESCAPLCQVYNSGADSAATRWITYDFGGNLKYQVDKQSLCLNDPGTYNLKITSTGTNGCSGTYNYPQPIIVHPTPDITIVTDPESPTITDNIMFGASTNYALSSYMWVFYNGSSGSADTVYNANPVRTYTNADTYPVFLAVSTDYGCADTVFKFLQIREDYNVFIPNTFTPNDDGHNDIFQMKGSGLSSNNFLMELVDRKGHVLFATRDINAGWDGTTNGVKVEPGVYVYKITVVGAHGEGKKEYIGQFSLLR